MKEFPGTPGTLTALLLRISQFLFAVGSIALMVTTSSFFQYTAFCYLIASLALQVIWSFALACLDACALARKTVLHNPILVTLFVVGDWVTATLTLSAASSSAGVIFLYTRDFGLWKGEDCMKYQISVSLAFFSWIMVGLSSLIMLGILAEG
ncbi:CASP-like protein 5B3 [Telopea speciosissima]|uniref:CASP-like protein 5B3 n=1 Tax=Telopea speciosissima TaxID=54955 RepID=UPI001CC3A602|nr:CASP-like protein 5B3 [Telopea speciosissima]